VQLEVAHWDHLVVQEVQWVVDWEGEGEGGVPPFLDRIVVARNVAESKNNRVTDLDNLGQTCLTLTSRRRSRLLRLRL
jgi:hypothetical protein